MLPGAAPVAAVVGGVVKGIGAFVKYLVSYAAKGDDVPGLKAMVPGGAFVEEINKTQQGQPGPGTNWYVVSSNFHVKLFDDSHNPPEFPRELVVKLGEGFVDKLFEGPNDLVVDVSSMDAIDAKVGGFVREVLALGENDAVYHTNYFSQLARDRGARRLAPTRSAGCGTQVLTGHPNQPRSTTTRKAPPHGSLRTVCRDQRVQVTAEEQLAERLRQRCQRHLQGAEEAGLPRAQRAGDHRQGRHEEEGDDGPPDDGGQGQAGGPRGVLVLEPRDAGAEPARRPGRAGRPRRGLRLLRPQAGRRGLGPQDRHRRRRAASPVRDRPRGSPARGRARHLPQRHRD